MIESNGICSAKCPRFGGKINSPCLWGEGPKDAKLMIIGREPGQEEDLSGRPFIGRSGQLLNKTLSKIGIRREDVYVTNVVKCANSGENKPPNKKTVKHCRVNLVSEIEEIKPSIIVVLGSVALESVLGKSGISKWKNNTYFSNEFNATVVPIYHPAYILRNPEVKKEFNKGFDIVKNLYHGGYHRGVVPKSTCKVAIADTKEKIDKVLTILESSDEFSFDLETSSLNPKIAEIGVFSVSWKDGYGVAIDWSKMYDGALNRLQKVMVSDKLKIGHGAKYDISVLLERGMRVKRPFFDTMISHSLINENVRHSLDECVLSYLDMGSYWDEVDEYKKKMGDDVNYLKIPMKVLGEYGAKDAVATYKLYRIFKEELVKQDLLNYHNIYSIRTMLLLTEMELYGIKIDREQLKILIGEYEEKLVGLFDNVRNDKHVKKLVSSKKSGKIKELDRKYNNSKMLQNRYNNFDEYCKKFSDSWVFNPRSAPQMKKLFFDKEYLGLTSLMKTDKGAPSTNKKVLLRYAAKGVQLAKLIMDYRRVAAYLSNFLTVVYRESESNGRIHTHFLQHSTVTGRLASQDPNLQNIPRDADDYKKCFIADDGYIFVKADLAQAEFRGWAHYSNDENLISEIKSGLDIHTLTASQVFDTPPEEVTGEQRTAAKRGTFGMMFGVSPQHIAEEFNISLKRAKLINSVIYAKYPKAVDWLHKQIGKVRKEGQLKSWLGRIRRLPDINSNYKNKRDEAERQALNCRIQMLACAMNDYYMSVTLEKARKAKIRCHPCLTIHDATIFVVEKDRYVEFIRIQDEVVRTEFPNFRCPMRYDFDVGRTLGDTKKVNLERVRQ